MEAASWYTDSGYGPVWLVLVGWRIEMLWVRKMEAPAESSHKDSCGCNCSFLKYEPSFIYNFLLKLLIWFHRDCCFIG